MSIEAQTDQDDTSRHPTRHSRPGLTIAYDSLALDRALECSLRSCMNSWSSDAPTPVFEALHDHRCTRTVRQAGADYVQC